MAQEYPYFSLTFAPVPNAGYLLGLGELLMTALYNSGPTRWELRTGGQGLSFLSVL